MEKNSKSDSNSCFTILTGLAQEINAPLHSLLLSSQKLIDTYKNKNFEYISYKDFRQILNTMEQMNKQIRRCYQTTGRLKILGQSKTHRESCAINEIVEDILGLLEQQCRDSKIKVHKHLQKNLPLVHISRLNGHQVIHNILANAVEAMPAGGNIKIWTLYKKRSKFVTIEVIDEGVGITSQHLPRVFEPFFTTKEQGVEKSSGLGLSIVYAIIQSVGGSIHIQSSLRKGTQVKILLPVAL